MPVLNALIEKLASLNEHNCKGYVKIEQQVQPCNLLLWLKAQPSDIKFFWRDKENTLTSAMLGQCHAIETLDYTQMLQGAKYFGGLPFPACSEQVKSQSKESKKNTLVPQFIIPRICLSYQDNVYRLTCHLDCSNNTLRHERQACLELLSHLQAPQQLPTPTNNTLLERSDLPNKNAWQQLVEKVTSAIADNVLKKVVLSRKSSLTYAQDIDPWLLLDQWGSQNSNCYQFALQYNADEVFIGCSPERLYLRNGSSLITESLAGTAKRGINQDDDDRLANKLLSNEKLVKENTLVKEDILLRLSPLSLDIGLDEKHVLKLQHIQHLKQRIHAFLKKEVNDQTLMNHLHPTPAVGGAPRRSSLAFLSENEPYQRGLYSGAVGFISEPQSELCVAIRSALINHNHVELFAGAGIVDGSQADKEWQELEDKISTALNLLS